ncbi:unnamed protein product [Acanthoscelides obtectus]|uniref:Uncharacterized protein n=1 Tax=Acanthoscelides obtectus TaxID=200917 RepID=A0A9P0P1X5_ACAOB|nr:unnamed protein product [Acanthoscelides obtectus]CAK1657137.1 hypothetical protein AOBTE_LOCUS20142 [Acanthoscelides obtectus]
MLWNSLLYEMEKLLSDVIELMWDFATRCIAVKHWKITYLYGLGIVVAWNYSLSGLQDKIMVFKYNKRKTERAQGRDETVMNRAINLINQRETSIRGAALHFTKTFFKAALQKTTCTT